MALFEVLPIDHHIRSLMIKRTPSALVRQSAVSRGMHSLWHAAWQAVQQGATSLEEVARVLATEPR